MNKRLGKYESTIGNAPVTKLWKCFHECFPLVAAFASGGTNDYISLKVTYRGLQDWLAVGKRFNDTGRPDVIFGSGPDFVSCLAGLEVAMEHDKWRPDKFFQS